MNENTKRKIRTGIMAALLMMLILLTGTYAWTQFNNVGFNAVYTNTNFGGRMHNNLEVKENSGEGVYNQNVFAENFGDNRIFVRARLREFMSTTEDGIPLIEGTHIKFPNGGTDGETTFEEWPLYQAQDGDVHTRRANTPSAIIGQNGIRWTLGHTGGDMYFMPTFNRTQGGDPSFLNGLHTSGVDVPFITETNAEWAHQMIEASGDAVDAWAARVLEEGAVDFDISNIEEARDIRTLGAQTSPQRADLEHSNGLRNFWEGATSAPTHYIYVDEDGFLTQSEEPIVEEARTTLLPEVPAGTKNGVMTFSEWNEIGREQGNFWVMDAQTGWFYFAMPLQPGEATPMLISEIEVQDRNDEGIEYVIEVDAQFMTRSSMTTSIMEDLNENVALLWGETEYEMTMEGMIEPTPLVLPLGASVNAGTITLSSNTTLNPRHSETIENPDITWAIEPTLEGVTVTQEGQINIASNARVGETYVVATVQRPTQEVKIRRRIDVAGAVYEFEMINPTLMTIRQGISNQPNGGVTLVRHQYEGATRLSSEIVSSALMPPITWTIEPAHEGVTVNLAGQVSVTDEALSGSTHLVATITTPVGEVTTSRIINIIEAEGSVIYTANMSAGVMGIVQGTTSASVGTVSLTRTTITGGNTTNETVSTADFANNIEWTIQPETPGITVHPAGNNLSATVTVASDVESGPGIVSVVATVPTANGPVSIERPINVIRAVRDTFIDEASTNETEWVILVDYDDEFGGIGNALYITRYVHGWTSGATDQSRQWNLTGAQGGPGNVFTMFESSNVRTTMQEWYDNDDYVSPEFRVRGLNYQFVDEAREVITDRNTQGAGIENDSSNTEFIFFSGPDRNIAAAPRALSRPAPSGYGQPFAFSVSEVHKHFTGSTGTHGRQAFRADDTEVGVSWWLRTPGESIVSTVAAIGENGTLSNGNSIGSARGFRPAIWVRR